jgi:D-3-phosphoglycerate dehydrogenase / 2-oxoglutarate reductase
MSNNVLVTTPILNINNVYDNLKKISNVIYMPNINPNELIHIISKHNINILFVNPNRQNYKLNNETLGDTNNLKIICTASTGTNHIDLNYCKDKNIKIISLKNERKILDSISSTSELAFTLLLSSIRNISQSTNSVKNKQWDCEPFIGRQLNKLSVGIIGYGRLGTMMAKYCDCFGANVNVYDPYIKNIPRKYKKIKNLDSLICASNIISLHVHATPENKYLISKKQLNLNPNLYLIINTSRGEIINEQDLVNWLNENDERKYATDVLESEFSDDLWESPLFNKLKYEYNVLITPHIGGMTHDAREIAYNSVIDLLKQEM